MQEVSAKVEYTSKYRAHIVSAIAACEYDKNKVEEEVNRKTLRFESVKETIMCHQALYSDFQSTDVVAFKALIQQAMEDPLLAKAVYGDQDVYKSAIEASDLRWLTTMKMANEMQDSVFKVVERSDAPAVIAATRQVDIRVNNLRRIIQS